MGILNDLLGKQNDNTRVLEIIRLRAQEAGWKIRTDNSGIIIIGFIENRIIENIYLKICGKNHDGKTIIEFSSTGIPLPDDIAASALFGLTLLAMNGEMLMGHWGIEDIGGDKYFTVFHSMFAEGMDVHEFKGAVLAVLHAKKKIMQDMANGQINM